MKEKAEFIKKYANNEKYTKIQIIEFEKDDPTNWHIDFVTSASNLRAINYKIK